MPKSRKDLLHSILEYVLIVLGAALCGAAMGTLMVPNTGDEKPCCTWW